MKPRAIPTRLRLAALPALGAACALFSLGLYACTSDNVAGGSSEVDNPQVLVAFVDASGATLNPTGSLGVYLSDQSPALDADPVVEFHLTGSDTVRLTPASLAAGGVIDSTRSFNLYFRGDDSTGSFLQNVSYDPKTGKFSRPDSADVKRVSLTVGPLIRSESVLRGVTTDTIGLNRVIIPGSPFQAVLVDSIFVFEGIPSGVYTVHVLGSNGVECPLPEKMDTQDPKYHNYNPDTTAVVRPPPPPPPPPFTVDAGEDRSITAGAVIDLVAEVHGVDSKDRRLAVLWRQLPASSQEAQAWIDHKTDLRAKVFFPDKAGAYTFVVTVILGSQQAQDTVIVGVQPRPVNPVFVEPSEGDTVYINRNFTVIWEGGAQKDSLHLEASSDSGKTWVKLTTMWPYNSKPGFNQFWWTPYWTDGVPPPSNCFLRLRRLNGEIVATSGRFVSRYPKSGH
jgi:hypothetical protein